MLIPQRIIPAVKWGIHLRCEFISIAGWWEGEQGGERQNQIYRFWRLKGSWRLQDASSAARGVVWRQNNSLFESSSDEKQKNCWAVRSDSAAAELFRYQQGVVAVDLQQVEQEEPVSVGIQTHGPHALLGQGGVGASCHLAQGLENTVVLLQEEPGRDKNEKAGGSGFF